jgi:hypothetical protein
MGSISAIIFKQLKYEVEKGRGSVKYPAAELRGIQFYKKLSSPLTGED